VARGVERAAERRAGAPGRPAGTGLRPLRPRARRRPWHEGRPEGRADARRGRHAREQRRDGLLRAARGHGGGLPRRLVPFRRHRGVAPRRLHRAARPQEGHHHLGWREHLHHRGRADGREAPGRARVRRRRGARREVGRAAEGVRHAQAGAEGDGAGGHRVLPAAHRPLQVPCGGGVLRPAEDVDRQGAEVRPARQGVEGPGEADQLVRHLSVLDQSPVRSGGTAADALHETLELAEACERWGYRRYWLAEHHGTPGLAGSSPEVLIGQVAARTSRIRVGAGGIMLQHYSPLKVAECFRVLETLFPGRIDLGIGRAPGADHLTTLALEDRGGDVSSEWGTERRSAPAAFPRQVADVIGFLRASFPEGHRYGKVIAMPSGPTVPEVWLLGSSDVSAALAAHFGTAFSFAHFINDEGGAPITRAYAAAFRPSPLLSAPRA